MLMHPQRITALLLAIVAMSFSGYAQARPEPFSLTLSTPKEYVQPGELLLYITLTNTTSHEICVSGGSPTWMFYRLEIHDEAGREPLFSRAMKALGSPGGSDATAALMPSFMASVLKPGQATEDVYEAAEVYDLGPGTYTIRVKQIIPEELGGRHVTSIKDLTPDDVIFSNAITVTVSK